MEIKDLPRKLLDISGVILIGDNPVNLIHHFVCWNDDLQIIIFDPSDCFHNLSPDVLLK